MNYDHGAVTVIKNDYQSQYQIMIMIYSEMGKEENLLKSHLITMGKGGVGLRNI